MDAVVQPGVRNRKQLRLSFPPADDDLWKERMFEFISDFLKEQAGIADKHVGRFEEMTYERGHPLHLPPQSIPVRPQSRGWLSTPPRDLFLSCGQGRASHGPGRMLP